MIRLACKGFDALFDADIFIKGKVQAESPIGPWL
jgi:hypothetical protein